MTSFRDQRIRRPVPLPASIKERLRQLALPRRLWTSVRATQVEREYERRREHYERLASERGLVYDEGKTEAAVRERLRARGYTPPLRKRGEIHTFACIPQFSWHSHLLPDLRALGEVTLFDYCALGFSVEELSLSGGRSVTRRREMFSRIVPAVRAAHARRPIDWIFCYGGGQDTSPHVMRELIETIGVPVVNMSLDDKQGWAGEDAGGWRTGAADITSSFDLYMTSARVACEWHMVEGGRPVYLPEGFDAEAFRPLGIEHDLDVSFAGGAYGFRADVIAFLRRHGVDVSAFGSGWEHGYADDLNAVFNRSRINLGMGGVEYSEWLTNVKGRDFEVPGAGGGVYLTSFNADLAQHFTVGEEILCYSSRDELLELVRYYLRHDDERVGIARRARERALAEHRWLHRYERLLRILGVLAA
jgi:hypothetical protein